MTKREIEDRAVECVDWAWLPGMRDSEGAMCTAVSNGRPTEWVIDSCVVDDEDLPGDWETGEDCPRPDLADFGTLGCLALSLLPSAWPGRTVEVTIGRRTIVAITDANGSLVGRSIDDNPGEAMITALEAAPRHRATVS